MFPSGYSYVEASKLILFRQNFPKILLVLDIEKLYETGLFYKEKEINLWFLIFLQWHGTFTEPCLSEQERRLIANITISVSHDMW